MEFVIVGLLAGAAAGCWALRTARISKKVKRQIPSPYSLIWAKPGSAFSASSAGPAASNRLWMNEMAEAAAVGALGLLPSFYYLSQLDENVLEAMEFAFAQDLSNFRDFHDYINEKYLGILEAESAEGWLTRLEGYVTEQYAADVLTRLGYEVEFPSSPNQAGWDLLVDGEPWQVKGGETPSVIAEHLAKHPDIPVVTSEELKSFFSDQSQVVGFKELNPDVIHEATEQTLAAADHLGDTVGAGVPVVALIMSSLRELKLWTEGKTNVFDSLKHVGIDMVGTGGGGLVGAKVGSTALSPLGPVGMAFGALVGGAAGAIFGRGLTNHFKLQKFRRALEDYQHAVSWSKGELERALERKRREMIRSAGSINQQLNKARDEIVRRYQTQFDDWKDSYIEKQRKFLAVLPDILTGIKRQLQEIERRELDKLQPSGFFRRYIVPTEDDLFYRTAKKWFATRYRLLDEVLSKCSDVPVDDKDVEMKYKEIIRFFRTYQADHPLLTKALEDLLPDDVGFRDSFRKQLFLAVDRAEKSFRNELNRVLNELKELVLDLKMFVNEKRERLIREGDKLGIDMRKYFASGCSRGSS